VSFKVSTHEYGLETSLTLVSALPPTLTVGSGELAAPDVAIDKVTAVTVEAKAVDLVRSSSFFVASINDLVCPILFDLPMKVFAMGLSLSLGAQKLTFSL